MRSSIRRFSWVALFLFLVAYPRHAAAAPVFQPPVFYPGGPDSLFQFVSADVFHRGVKDLVVATGTAQLNLLKGNGDGTFRPAVTIYSDTHGQAVVSVQTGDFNADGNLDCAIHTSGPVGADHLVIALGDGLGHLRVVQRLRLDVVSFGGAQHDCLRAARARQRQIRCAV